jgi:hypothetical protein
MMLEYFFPDNSSGIIAENNFVPDNIILYQNYPNPFNPSTNIRFEVPHSTHIKLVLYDLLGREIKILFEGGALAGMNEIELNAENLAGGIYFYRLISEDFIATKKLILLK